MNHENAEVGEPAEAIVQAEDSLDEGGEYMDDGLRMTDQAFMLN